MSAGPTISVLLPNYNHAQFLPRALNALAGQTMQPFEIVVIDDCSTDDSLEVLEDFASRMPNLAVRKNEKNLGVNESVNRAARAASGDFIVCSAADDWLEADFIAEMMAMIEKAPDLRLCVSQYVEHLEAADRFVLHEEDSELGQWYLGREPKFFTATEFAGLLRRGFVWLPITGAVIHRETFLSIGGYDAKLRWHSDWFATYAIALRYGFAAIPKPLANFRVAGNTYSSGITRPDQQRAVCRAIYAKMRETGFHDIGALIRRYPASLSPFMHHMLTGLASRPIAWPFALRLSLWWLNEARKGRRPGFVRRIAKSWGIRVAPR